MHKIKKFSIKENTRTDIIGKCNGWYYVKTRGRKGFLGKKRVSYIGFDSTYNTMYRYNYKTLRTELVHKNSDSKNIRWKITKNKSAVKVRVYSERGNKYLKVFANMPKTVTIRARYYYSKDRYIQRYRRLKIKPVKITLKITNRQKYVGKEYKINAYIKHVKGVKITDFKFYTKSGKVAKVIKRKTKKGKTYYCIKGRSIGSTTLHAEYKALKKKKKVKINMLLLYESVNREGKQIKWEKNKKGQKGKEIDAEDLTFNNEQYPQVVEGTTITDKEMNRSAKKLKNSFASLLVAGTIISGRQMAGYLYNYFIDSNGGIYTLRDEIPGEKKFKNKIYKHENTKDFINAGSEALEKLLKREYNYDINKIKPYTFTVNKNQRVKNFKYIKYLLYKTKAEFKDPIKFEEKGDYVNGLGILIHVMIGGRIGVSSYEKITQGKNKGKYKITLQYQLYDHFGLDKNDIKDNDKYNKFAKWVINHTRGFHSWYILQHWEGYNGKYRPFITKLTTTRTVTVKKIKE